MKAAPASFRAGADVIYGERVQGEYTKELVRTGTIPEHIVEKSEDGLTVTREFDRYPYGYEVRESLDKYATEIGQGVTVIIVDGWLDPEKVRKAMVVLFG